MVPSLKSLVDTLPSICHCLNSATFFLSLPAPPQFVSYCNIRLEIHSFPSVVLDTEHCSLGFSRSRRELIHEQCWGQQWLFHNSISDRCSDHRVTWGDCGKQIQFKHEKLIGKKQTLTFRNTPRLYLGSWVRAQDNVVLLNLLQKCSRFFGSELEVEILGMPIPSCSLWFVRLQALG